MTGATSTPRFRFWLWLILLIGVIVPRRLRADWRHEWHAELQTREALLVRWDKLDWRMKLDLFRRSLSAFWDALWMQSYRWEDAMIQDLRFGARMLMKQPGFTLIAVLTLALGIGANVAMFSLFDALLLKPPAGVADAERLVRIGQSSEGRGFNNSSFANYRDYRDQNTTLAGIAAESTQAFNLGTDKAAERVWGALVTGNYFDLLGVRAANGRLLQPDDATDGSDPVAVISERIWHKHFGTESPVGRSISLNAHSYTIVGVAAEFKGTSATDENRDVWIPVTRWRDGNPWMVSIGVDWLNSRGSQFLNLVGRLKPGVTLAQAQADLDIISQGLAQMYPQTNAKIGARVVAGLGILPEDRDELTQLAGILIGIVAIVLLIACANVAGLLVARSAARQKEIGVRLALGAGRLRIVRQLATESALLAMLGGALGALVAQWVSGWMIAMLPQSQNDMKARLAFALDWRVVGITLGLSMATAVLFGLAPALQCSKPDLISVLKETPGASSGRGRANRLRLRNVLVTGQIGLTLVLLISAALCLRTLRNAQAINLGFAYENLLTARLDLGRQGYSEEQGRRFYSQVLERARSMPGVESASLALSVPLQGNSRGTTVSLDNGQEINIRYNIISPDYLNTMSIPLLVGRPFTEQDSAQSPLVAIINESFAHSAWPGDSPIGKYFKWKDRKVEKPVQVIGIARDAKGSNLFASVPGPTAYLPLNQLYDGGMALHLRTYGKPEQLVAAVQSEISAIDKRLPAYDVRTLEQYLDEALNQKQIQAQIIIAFGLLALLLASIGLYGVLAYSVSQRTHEIGIRMALGAERPDVLRLVVGQGMKLVALGLLLGLFGALATTQLLRSLLYGVGPTDPWTFGGVTLLLACVAFLACWLPARRATKVDPMIALRHE
jgi:predicted permease